MTFPLTDNERHILNRRLLNYLRKVATRGPNHERVGPFLVTFSPTNDNPYVNYAMPDDDAEPSEADIAALIATFEARKRKPRFEYIPAAAPKVEAALLATGFKEEMRPPVMACLPGMEVETPAPSGFDIFSASTDGDLAGAELSQAEAYGSPSQGSRGLRSTVKYGGVVVAARDKANGTIAGAGGAIPPVDGISEITGIGVRPAYQRRGIAAAVTALLTREAFAKGITLAWLTPGGPDAQRIYARAGYAIASEALHISR